MQRNFEFEPTNLMAIPTVGCPPAVGPPFSENVTSKPLALTSLHEGGSYQRRADDQASRELEGDK